MGQEYGYNLLLPPLPLRSSLAAMLACIGGWWGTVNWHHVGVVGCGFCKIVGSDIGGRHGRGAAPIVSPFRQTKLAQEGG